jgi:hypothetical protein
VPAMGDKVKAGDFPQAKSAHDGTDELAFTSTSYTKGGTTVGVTFVAPTTGRVLLFWHARMENNGTAANCRTIISIEVATGGTIGSGSVVSAADDDSAIETTLGAAGGEQSRMEACMYRFVSGLTAGNTYNAYTMHKTHNASGSGDIFTRGVVALPLP